MGTAIVFPIYIIKKRSRRKCRSFDEDSECCLKALNRYCWAENPINANCIGKFLNNFPLSIFNLSLTETHSHS